MKTVMRDALENNADAFYEKWQLGKDENANALHPYVYLYEMMKLERSIILRYRDETAKMW